MISKGDRKLIVNADDLGYSQQRDKAAFELIEKNIVTSVTILVNASSTATAFQKANQLNFDLGIHLNLTEGKPIIKTWKTLVDQKGNFFDVYRFYSLLFAGKLDSEQIYGELRSQLELFVKSASKLPNHFDGHHHIHMAVQVAKILVVLAQQFGIYKYRYPVERQTETLMQGINESRQIYLQNNLIATDAFFGMNIGKDVKMEVLENSLSKVRDCYLVQYMVHPGYINKQEDEFNQSIDREKQKYILSSVQFQELLQREGLTLTGWKSCRPKYTSMKKILIYSQLKKGTGNYSTCFRIKRYLQEMGYKVYTRNINEQPELIQNQVIDIEQFCRCFGIDLIIGINIYRSGSILKKAFYDSNRICYQVPYLLMIAGTDANIYIKDESNRKNMMQSVEHSIGLISLTKTLEAEFLKYTDKHKFNKQIFVIPQSETESEIHRSENEKLLESLQLTKKPYVIFPASMRPVKDIQFLLKELNELINELDIQVYVFGPILDQHYFNQIEFKRVKYLGVIENPKLLTLLKYSICLINSSISEGMSGAILEAQTNKVLVLARDNQGNRSMIQDKKSGILFTSPQEFKDRFLWMLSNKQQVLVMIENAYERCQNQFSKSTEFNGYKVLLQRCFSTFRNQFTVQNSHTSDNHSSG